ncbi:MAG TPA: hypothetical protein VFH27_11325 [Longimicrobiaceae bacterium]|nr:hypothetical protein [Longimicrobiaceae bacterium]
MSKTKLLVGAGALFLFIVGVRKTWHRPDESAAPGELEWEGEAEWERDRDREQGRTRE